MGAGGFDAGVKLGLHTLPDGVPVGPDDHGAADWAAFGQLGLGQYVLVPLREVGCLRSEHVGFGHGRTMLEEAAPAPED